MVSIGIVGAGVAGLHLGLHLLQQGLDTTIYTANTAEQVRDGRIMNSVAHFAATIEREERLGIAEWPDTDAEYLYHHHYNGWGEDRRFHGKFEKPGRIIDYRIYLPRVMGIFEERGGTFDYGALTVSDIEKLTEVHDLVVVSTGKGEIGAMFPRRADLSPYNSPQRMLGVGFWHGVAERNPRGVEISVVPGVGELLVLPMWSFSGKVNALLFEGVPGGPQEVISTQKYADDPAAYRQLVLDIVEEHHPTVFERIDQTEFRLQNDKDILQGALTPVIREDFIQLANGRFLLAMGDIHMTVDPVQAQGANSATYSAEVIARTIAEDKVFDEYFMRKVASRRAERLQASAHWTNLIVQTPPADQIPQLFTSMVGDQTLADRFTRNFNFPIDQLQLINSPERVSAAVEGRN